MSNDASSEVSATLVEWGQPRAVRARPKQRRERFIDRPRHLADRSRVQGDRRKVETDAPVLETFTLPLEAARLKVRDIIDSVAQGGYLRIVERWRQLPDGNIEFTMRRVPALD